MFEILRKSLRVGVATEPFPQTTLAVAPASRGRPAIDFSNWKDARAAARVCPTGAIQCRDLRAEREAILDLGNCIFCGLCAEVDPQIRMAPFKPETARAREALITRARYALDAQGRQMEFRGFGSPAAPCAKSSERAVSGATGAAVESDGDKVREKAQTIFGRSLHIREVDAGSCNGCEIEITNLNSPIYDLERFGIHFVASPRHADLLLVTGPVARNMAEPLRKTYEAMPGPRLVAAVGACGCGGGIYGANYASLGGVEKVLPVDVFIPGCPPHPAALLHGLLTAMGRL